MPPLPPNNLNLDSQPSSTQSKRPQMPSIDFPPTPPATPFATTFLPGPPSPSKLYHARSEVVYHPSPPTSPGIQSTNPFDSTNKPSSELPRDARQSPRGKARPMGRRTLSQSFGLTLRGTKEESDATMRSFDSLDKEDSSPCVPIIARRASVMLPTGLFRSPRLRKSRLLTGLLFSAAVFCIIFLFSPAEHLSPSKWAPQPRQHAPTTVRQRRTKTASTTPWHWPSPKIELAALLNFVLGEQYNHLTYTDNDSLSPDLLEFDPRSPGGSVYLEEIESTVFLNNPVILLVDDSRHSRYAKAALNDLNAKAKVVRVNHRADAAAVVAVLTRIIGGSEALPLLIIDGEVIGNWADMDAFQKTDGLKTLLQQARLGTTVHSPLGLKRKLDDGRAAELRKRLLVELTRDEEDREALLSAQLPIVAGLSAAIPVQA